LCLIRMSLLGILGHTGGSNNMIYSGGWPHVAMRVSQARKICNEIWGWGLWVTPRGVKT